MQKTKIDFDNSSENCTLGLEKSKEMKQYIVDAFTNEPFSGNPAAVCVMDHWPPEKSMMKLAMENNLSETAFIVKEEASIEPGCLRKVPLHALSGAM